MEKVLVACLLFVLCIHLTTFHSRYMENALVVGVVANLPASTKNSSQKSNDDREIETNHLLIVIKARGYMHFDR